MRWAWWPGGSAMNLNVGQWSEVLEEPGAFLRVRLLERKEGAAPAAAWLRMDRIEASYVPENETGPNQDTEMRRHHLTIVDPAWDAIIPERTKYLMGVHDQ